MISDELREQRRQRMRRLWKEGKLSAPHGNRLTKIKVSQCDDYAYYQREYQRQYRKSRKSYYRLRQLWDREYRDTVSWQDFYSVFKDTKNAKEVRMIAATLQWLPTDFEVDYTVNDI